MMPIIARCNGTVLTEDDGRLGLVEIGGGWLGTALFVSVLVASIASINGAVLLAIGPRIAGAAVLGLGLGAAFVATRFWRMRRRIRDRGPGPPWLIFDPARGLVCDGSGNPLAPLAQVRLARSFQLGSSSKALTLELPNRKLVLARGTPFGDSVEDLEQALRARIA